MTISKLSFDGNAKDKRTKFFMQNTSSWNISNWFYCFQKYFRKRDKNDRRHEKSSFMVNFMSFTNFFAADEIRCDHRFSLLLLRRFCGHIHKSRSTIQKTVFLLNECPVNMQTEDFSFFLSMVYQKWQLMWLHHKSRNPWHWILFCYSLLKGNGAKHCCRKIIFLLVNFYRESFWRCKRHTHKEKERWRKNTETSLMNISRNFNAKLYRPFLLHAWNSI